MRSTQNMHRGGRAGLESCYILTRCMQDKKEALHQSDGCTHCMCGVHTHWLTATDQQTHKMPHNQLQPAHKPTEVAFSFRPSLPEERFNCECTGLTTVCFFSPHLLNKLDKNYNTSSVRLKAGKQHRSNHVINAHAAHVHQKFLSKWTRLKENTVCFRPFVIKSCMSAG